MTFAIKTQQSSKTIDVDLLSMMNDLQASYEGLMDARLNFTQADRLLANSLRAIKLVKDADDPKMALQLLDVDGGLTTAFGRDMTSLKKEAATESLTELAKTALRKFLNACKAVWEWLVNFFRSIKNQLFSSRQKDNELKDQFNEAFREPEFLKRFNETIPSEMHHQSEEGLEAFGILTKEVMPFDDTIKCVSHFNNFTDKLFNITTEWFSDMYSKIMSSFEKASKFKQNEKGLEEELFKFDDLFANMAEDMKHLCEDNSTSIVKYDFNQETFTVKGIVVYQPHSESKTIKELGWGSNDRIRKFFDEHDRFIRETEIRHQNMDRVLRNASELRSKAINEMDSIQNSLQMKFLQTLLRTLNMTCSLITAHELEVEKIFKTHRRVLERCLKSNI